MIDFSFLMAMSMAERGFPTITDLAAPSPPFVIPRPWASTTMSTIPVVVLIVSRDPERFTVSNRVIPRASINSGAKKGTLSSGSVDSDGGSSRSYFSVSGGDIPSTSVWSITV